MTDLISRLSDDILALINAQPRSPTKEEIEGVLRQKLDAPFVVPQDMLLDGVTLAPGWISYGPYPLHDCQGEWAITQEDLVKAADAVCEREAVRKSDLYAAYEAKAQLPCPDKQWAAPAGEHHWRPMGFDARGLFCQVGYKSDVSGGTHLHCTCGASKFTA